MKLLDTRSRRLREYDVKYAMKPAFIASVLLVAVAVPTVCRAIDSRTVYGWKRTFYTQSALDRPLRPYFVPRYPGDCGREVHWERVARPYPAATGMDFEPVRLERLGHIPNDFSADAAAAGR